MTTYPQFFRLRQKFARPKVEDVPGAVRSELEKLDLSGKVRPGQSVAITVGSRGIAGIPVIIKEIVAFFRSLGAEPFLVPAMGSHGGATPEGQTEVLMKYGVTEEFCGCPIHATMETVVVAEAPGGFPIHFDRNAYEADHVVICNRVKLHTMFAGRIESGLMKMMIVGLGKQNGAKVTHAAALESSFEQHAVSVVDRVLSEGGVVAGLMIVENAFDETGRIEAVLPEDFVERERAMLNLSREWMAKLPFERVDILLVDEMGKNISGVGIDTNVVGRKYNDNMATDEEPYKVKRIVVRSLTEKSQGNAMGIGIADFCTRRLADCVDRKATWTNALTAGHIGAVKMPLILETDREILDAALPTLGMTDAPDAKVLWIRNTLDLLEVECSRAFLAEAESRDDLEVLTPLHDLPFDAEGNLPATMSDGSLATIH